MKLCTIDGCERDRNARGLCGTHYARWRRNGGPLVLQDRTKPPCLIEGCAGEHEAQGYCAKHYQRWARHGDPHGGIWHQAASGVVTYMGAHWRVKKRRGKAAEHPCQHCAEPAQEWAYDHLDPDEVLGDEGHGRVAPYSLDVEHYMPLCVPCHRTFDQAPNRPTDAA